MAAVRTFVSVCLLSTSISSVYLGWRTSKDSLWDCSSSGSVLTIGVSSLNISDYKMLLISKESLEISWSTAWIKDILFSIVSKFSD